MRRKKPSDAEYDVGYGKPPKATRFQPGQSGNSRGRPKGTKNAKLLLEQILDEIVTVSEGAVPQRMTKRQAFLKTLVTRAYKNARYAALLLKPRIDQHPIGDIPGTISCRSPRRLASKDVPRMLTPVSAGARGRGSGLAPCQREATLQYLAGVHRGRQGPPGHTHLHFRRALWCVASAAGLS
jgi:hypothetical protein